MVSDGQVNRGALTGWWWLARWWFSTCSIFPQDLGCLGLKPPRLSGTAGMDSRCRERLVCWPFRWCRGPCWPRCRIPRWVCWVVGCLWNTHSGHRRRGTKVYNVLCCWYWARCVSRTSPVVSSGSHPWPAADRSDLCRIWHDKCIRTMPLFVYIVEPQPPTDGEAAYTHVLLTQQPVAQYVPTLASTRTSRNLGRAPRGPTAMTSRFRRWRGYTEPRTHAAFLVRQFTNRFTLLTMLDLAPLCFGGVRCQRP